MSHPVQFIVDPAQTRRWRTSSEHAELARHPDGAPLPEVAEAQKQLRINVLDSNPEPPRRASPGGCSKPAVPRWAVKITSTSTEVNRCPHPTPSRSPPALQVKVDMDPSRNAGDLPGHGYPTRARGTGGMGQFPGLSVPAQTQSPKWMGTGEGMQVMAMACSVGWCVGLVCMRRNHASLWPCRLSPTQPHPAGAETRTGHTKYPRNWDVLPASGSCESTR
jgi:hypothetical protein